MGVRLIVEHQELTRVAGPAPASDWLRLMFRQAGSMNKAPDPVDGKRQQDEK
jgi:hypothetical protein